MSLPNLKTSDAEWRMSAYLALRDGVVVGGEDVPVPDPVEHPAHYTGHPSGVECITVTEHMGFCLGNAIKYIWRADLKADALEDLRKARWYLDREIARRDGGHPA